MKIEQLFVKSISRNLEGVIKIGSKTPDIIEQELDEYVVTRELQKHVKEFFTAYAEALDTPTTNMGVWISGFFGSGKSHLLQILAYLLENIEVNGKHAIDFFVDEPKIADPDVLKTMQAVAANAPDTDVILFNVDSKNQQTSNGSKELLQIFVNVFNEMRGYSPSMPYVARLEEYLDRKGKYQAFKEAYEEISDAPWEEGRNDFLFVMEDVKAALVQLGVYDEDEADKVVESLETSYAITIQQFAKEVADYCRAKGKRHRVVFLVDEIGQYIGNNSRLMLDLQTITEELSHAGGQAWIIVTSQQNIDEVIKVSGDDFSKIQGRFHTRLSLSSSNVDEVLKRRILAKTDDAQDALTGLYDVEELNLRNVIRFTDNMPFQRSYEDRRDFSETYPFVSYQFDLLQHTLTDIRKNSASGKSIASGERSMLAVFKESAQARKEEETGILIPYDAFYDPIAKFVDHIHQQVIIKAGNNKRLDAFSIRVLKVLFLVKYVKSFKANVDNITTLLADDIHTDRLVLRQNVMTALQMLMHEVLVQKNLDEYAFLTDQEQDINRNIRNMTVDADEITRYIGSEIYNGILKNQAFKYSNRYTFRYDQYIDDRLVTSGSHNVISINILTPYAITGNNLPYTEETIALKGMNDITQLILRLPPNATFWDDITKVLQIQKYSQKATSTNAVVTGIMIVKNQEREELRQYITQNIREALGQADVFIKGDKKHIRVSSPAERVQTGIKLLIETVFNKLNKMGGQEPSEQDIQRVLQEAPSAFRGLTEENQEASIGAQEEIYQFLELRLARQKTVVLSEVLDRFHVEPYGFDQRDILYCLARLYKKGRITLKLHGEILGQDTKPQVLYSYLAQTMYREQLVLAPRVAVAKKKIEAVKYIRHECFRHVTPGNEEDDVMKWMKEDLQDEIAYITERILPHFDKSNRYHDLYQGENVAKELRAFWQDALSRQQAESFFTYFYEKQDDILDVYEEGYEDIRRFFDPKTPQQIQLFQKGCDLYLHVRRDLKSVTSQDVRNAYADLESVLKSKQLYRQIKDIQSLVETLRTAYQQTLEAERLQMISGVETIRDELITQVIDMAVFTGQDSLRTQAVSQFSEYKKDILHATYVNEIKIAHSAARDKRDWFVKEVNRRAAAYKEEQERKAKEKQPDHVADPKPANGFKPKPPVLQKPSRVFVAMTMHELRPHHGVSLQSEADVDTFVAEIRRTLMQKIKDGNNITIIE